jgi:hypothetical protein
MVVTEGTEGTMEDIEAIIEDMVAIVVTVTGAK